MCRDFVKLRQKRRCGERPMCRFEVPQARVFPEIRSGCGLQSQRNGTQAVPYWQAGGFGHKGFPWGKLSRPNGP